jgi:hypothetical protein
MDLLTVHKWTILTPNGQPADLRRLCGECCGDVDGRHFQPGGFHRRPRADWVIGNALQRPVVESTELGVAPADRDGQKRAQQVQLQCAYGSSVHTRRQREQAELRVERKRQAGVPLQRIGRRGIREGDDFTPPGL